ncbi:hypothetical protein C0J52_14277 [Blattella germanica]|nr:hypothetical protein C0J52_14277 [Blattella germanica]
MYRTNTVPESVEPDPESFNSEMKDTNSFFATNFSSIINTETYMDKSLLIYKLFQHQEESSENNLGVLISAPKGFGKTINIDMVRCFLEIQENEQYDRKGQEIPVEERSNYKLFEGLKIMAPEYTKFVTEHFGKYPVLMLNLQCFDRMRNLDEMVSFCREMVHKTFLQYRYLASSPMLNAKQKSFCEAWCRQSSHHLFGPLDVQAALKFLCGFLCLHFKKDHIYLLIDDYDSCILHVVHNATLYRHQRFVILNYYTSVLTSLLKDNTQVIGAFVTGRSYSAAEGLTCKLDNLAIYRLLHDSYFADYYGLTSKEIDGILSNSTLRSSDKAFIKCTYGYESNNGQPIIYCPQLVMKYLSHHESGMTNLIVG